jgi:excisionase family DNA binding protein
VFCTSLSCPGSYLKRTSDFEVLSVSQHQYSTSTPSPILSDDWFEFSPTAKLLRVSDRTLYRWTASGYAPRHMKIGKRVVFRRSAIEEWLKSREEKPRPVSVPTAPSLARRRNPRREPARVQPRYVRKAS